MKKCPKLEFEPSTFGLSCTGKSLGQSLFMKLRLGLTFTLLAYVRSRLLFCRLRPGHLFAGWELLFFFSADLELIRPDVFFIFKLGMDYFHPRAVQAEIFRVGPNTTNMKIIGLWKKISKIRPGLTFFTKQAYILKLPVFYDWNCFRRILYTFLGKKY